MEQLNLKFGDPEKLEEKRKQLLGDWYYVLRDEFEKEYMTRISNFLAKRYKETEVYPPKHQIFEAFKQCPYYRTKIIVIGQDPYHTPGVAHGLVFSTKKEKTPPSLINIYKEIESELGEHTFNHNDLTQWANQGMLLLNAALTVERGKPKSHMEYMGSKGIGWNKFIDRVIEELNEHHNKLIFLLWGKFAQSFEPKIDSNKHYILQTSHPSPFSADKGFFGCGHFKRIKELYPEMDFNVY